MSDNKNKRFRTGSELVLYFLEGSKKLFLQQYKLSDGVRDKELHAIKEETTNKYFDILSQYIDMVELRGY